MIQKGDATWTLVRWAVKMFVCALIWNSASPNEVVRNTKNMSEHFDVKD